jgi:hypothetical protein
MNFIRIGDQVINLDSVSRAKIAPDKVALYFTGNIGGMGKPDADMASFKGEEAKSLYDYFIENSRDVSLGPKKTVTVQNYLDDPDEE